MEWYLCYGPIKGDDRQVYVRAEGEGDARLMFTRVRGVKPGAQPQVVRQLTPEDAYDLENRVRKYASLVGRLAKDVLYWFPETQKKNA